MVVTNMQNRSEKQQRQKMQLLFEVLILLALSAGGADTASI